jgi:hypothetical protein
MQRLHAPVTHLLVGQINRVRLSLILTTPLLEFKQQLPLQTTFSPRHGHRSPTQSHMSPADRQPQPKVRFEKVKVSQLQQQLPELGLNSMAGAMEISYTCLILTLQSEQAQ